MMMRCNHIVVWLAAAVTLLSALAVSCTRVEFSEELPDMESVGQDESAKSEISFEVDWRSLGLADAQVPDDMLVLMSRLQNVTLHYVWHISRYGTIFRPGEEPPGDDSFTEGEIPVPPVEGASANDGEEETDIPEDEPAEGEPSEGEVEEEDDDDDSAKVYNGLYSIMAVASVDSEDYFVPHLDRFPDSLALRMRDMYVEIPQISDEEKKEQVYMDFNPFYPFIRSVNPLYFVRSEEETHQQISSLEDNVIRLMPMAMTRKITFTIDADIEEGVTVDRMVGIISGVPASAQMMSGYVDKENLCKMPFEMTKASSGSYSGSVNVFGLFPSDSPDLITGAGVFNLILHASVQEGGILKKRVFHASINLMETITAADVMVQADDMIHYTLNGRDDLTLRIADKLEVTRDKILTGSDQGFEIWQGNNTDDDPGLNPEI